MSDSHRFVALLAAGLLVLTGAGCQAGRTFRPVTSPGWPRVSPSAAGLDADRLDAIAERAKDGKSNCLAVVRDGKLAGEWYFRGTGPDTTQDHSLVLMVAVCEPLLTDQKGEAAVLDCR